MKKKIKKKKSDFFSYNNIEISYKNVEILSKFLSIEGRILPSRRTGLTAKNQRKLSKEIKKARVIGFLPFIKE